MTKRKGKAVSKPKDVRTMLSVTVAPRTHDTLDELAEKYAMSRGQLVDIAINALYQATRVAGHLAVTPWPEEKPEKR